MAIKNCLGKSATDLKNDLKNNTDTVVMNQILNVRNNNTNGAGTKSECASLCSNSILENYNEFLIYCLAKQYDKINQADRFNLPYDSNGSLTHLINDFPGLVTDFDELVSNGGGKSLNDTVNKYGDGYLYPGGLSQNQKNDILQMMKDSDFYSENFTGSRSIDSFNSVVVDDATFNSSTLKEDTLFRPDGMKSFIASLSNEYIESLALDSKVFKCFKFVFEPSNYIIYDKLVKPPIVTPAKIENLRRIHEEILLPLYNYYYNGIDENVCAIKIVNGLTSIDGAITSAGGSIISKHINGEAVDISLVGIDRQQVFDDLKKGLLPIKFGVATLTNGIHFTTTYTFNGYEVSGLIIDSPKKSSDFIELNFI